MDMQNAAYWIKRLMLKPHAMESGYYKVSFRSSRQVLNPVFDGARLVSCATAPVSGELKEGDKTNLLELYPAIATFPISGIKRQKCAVEGLK